jgi:hypothetical protein
VLGYLLDRIAENALHKLIEKPYWRARETEQIREYVTIFQSFTARSEIGAHALRKLGNA